MELTTAINEARELDAKLDDMNLRIERSLVELDKARRITKEVVNNLESMLTRVIADEKNGAEYRNRLGRAVRDLGGMSGEEAKDILKEIKGLTGWENNDIAYQLGLSANTVKNWAGEWVNLSAKSANALKRLHDRVKVSHGKPVKKAARVAPAKSSDGGVFFGVEVPTHKACRLFRLLVAGYGLMDLDMPEEFVLSEVPWEHLRFIAAAACLAGIDPAETAAYFDLQTAAVVAVSGPALNQKERELARRILQAEVQFMADNGYSYT